MESDELIKYSVKNLVPRPSESKDRSDVECDLPLCDDSPRSNYITSSNPLFDSNGDFTSSNNDSFFEEDIPMENFKIFSNPLFDLDEEIISTKVNPICKEVLESIDSIPPDIDHFDAESDLLESFLNQDISIDSSPKIDSLLDEFASELTLLKSIPSGINDDNLDLEDVFFASDGSMPPGIDSDGSDSEGDNLFIERLLYDDLIPLPEYDHFQFNNEPAHPTLDSDFIHSSDFLGSNLHVSSPSGDRNKIYDPGICIKVESTRFLATLSP
nr:hypothetical protein [Tanacetum cinerariifolium]